MGDGASVSNEEDIFVVKKKNTGIPSDIVDSDGKRPNSEEDAASKNKNKGVKDSNATLPKFTVMEVKVVQGTSDVALVNGMLRVGDRIVVAGLQAPVVSSISSLLTPHPVKKPQIQGRVFASQKNQDFPGYQNCCTGTSLYVVRPNDDIEVIKKSAMAYVNSVMSRIRKHGERVYVQASTL
ncbi:eukaryotic translation initiation factor 5B-like isoform X2 [Salvia hispanica]|uniref:eukaryotic translation initiation factor 5B-like isoform X2 n=1 Tax=Salvia hispanica TaxID=49212 RepID=UPI0020093624|nr:eukaryotic translation initiation factor 5B-like isoform X2 [Salvia hispanica]